jgi:hypothetical protein
MQGLTSQVYLILEILIQQRATLRQQHDEIDALHSQLEELQSNSCTCTSCFNAEIKCKWLVPICWKPCSISEPLG